MEQTIRGQVVRYTPRFYHYGRCLVTAGASLFGTSAYAVDISAVSELMALRIYPISRSALRSQIPPQILMVAYSILSLWILAQRVVDTG